MAKTEGIVTSIRELSNSNCAYWITLIGADRTVRIRSSTKLQLMEKVELEIDSEEEDKRYDVVSLGIASQSEYTAAQTSILRFLEIRVPTVPDIGAGNPMADELVSQIMDAASRLAKNIVSGAPISVHFHSDGDGSTGAIGLYRGFKAEEQAAHSEHRAIKWDAVRGVAYNEESLYSDELFFKSFSSAERPITIITDFGSTSDSNSASRRLGRLSDIIWIDHHPTDKGFEKPATHYINPWDHNGDSSLTAGLITCMLASSLGAVGLEEIMLVSLLSDHSSLAKPNKEKEDIAAVLDAINIHNPDRLPTTPQYMESILSDKEKFAYVLSESREQMASAISIGLKKGRMLKSNKGFMIFVLDFEKVAKMRFSYIKMGKYTSELHSAIESDGNPSITVVYHKRYISARASKSIASTSILLDTIRKMSENGEVENGGGHNEAASMRLLDSDAEVATKKFVSYLGGAF